MKLTEKQLEQLIDNFLKEDASLLNENFDSKKMLYEQPAGVNTQLSWRYPDTGEECKLNIASLLMKAGLPEKPADNINDALSFTLSRFLGLNSWMCNIINVGLGVGPVGSGKNDKNDLKTSLDEYFESYTEEDWKKTYENLSVNSKESFENNLIKKLTEARVSAGINSAANGKRANLVAKFLDNISTTRFFNVFTSAMFHKHNNKSNGIDQIIKNIKKSKDREAFFNSIIDDIKEAILSNNSKFALKELNVNITESELKDMIDDIKI